MMSGSEQSQQRRNQQRRAANGEGKDHLADETGRWNVCQLGRHGHDGGGRAHRPSEMRAERGDRAETDRVQMHRRRDRHEELHDRDRRRDAGARDHRDAQGAIVLTASAAVGQPTSLWTITAIRPLRLIPSAKVEAATISEMTCV